MAIEGHLPRYRHMPVRVEVKDRWRLPTIGVKMEPTAEQILELVAAYAANRHRPAQFDPANPVVPVSGKVFGPEEVVELVRSSLDFWLTSGPETQRFQRALARRAGVRHALMVNSGSSANLLAISTLCASGLRERRLRPGDEVITVAAGFPTTVNPLIQNGLVPVFVDVELPGYDLDVTQLEAALSPRTSAVMIAHTLGNPFDLDDDCGVLRPARAGAGRGLLRCPGRHLQRAARRNVRRPGDADVLSRPPDHHGRGRRGADAARPLRRWPSRSATGAGTAGATPAATTPAASGSAAAGRFPSATTTSTSTRDRLQPEGNRPPGRNRGRPAGRLDGFVERAPTTMPAPPGGARRSPGHACASGGDARGNPTWFGFAICLHEDAPISRNELRSGSRRGGSPPGCCSPATCCASPPTSASSTA